jgi:predicted nucleic acid-binding protein
MAGDLLDPFCPPGLRFLGIVDTNALLSSVVSDCRRGPRSRSRLLRMANGGAAVLYAADHVYAEAYEHLPTFARTTRVPEPVLRARLEEQYLPAVRFVTVGASLADDPQVLAIADPDDVPTGQLAKLIAPGVVFSADKHLRRPGLAPPDWRDAAGHATDIVDGASRQRTTVAAAVLPFRGAAGLISALNRGTGIPAWALWLTAGGGAAWLLRTPGRRDAAGRYVLPVLEHVGAEMERSRLQEERGLAGLRQVILPAPVAPPASQQVAITLARAQEPLLAREIQDRMPGLFPGRPLPAVSEIRAVLAGSSEFIQPERYRWAFGREAAPWKG